MATNYKKNSRVWTYTLAAAVVVALVLYYLQTPSPGSKQPGKGEEDLVPIVAESPGGVPVTDSASLDQSIGSRQDLQESISAIDSVDVDYLDAGLEANDQDAANF